LENLVHVFPVSSRTLIIGCGYVGLPLAISLQRKGHEVTGWVHSVESAASLAAYSFRRIIMGSVADSNVWTSLGEDYDLVIHCASSGRGGESSYEEVFLKGMLMLKTHQARARRLFVSSTSVYRQLEGEVVTENSPAEPDTATGRILRVAEKVALDSGATVVRSSGIYGPDRAVLFEKLRRGEAVIEGDGLRWMNQIHQRDLVSALERLAKADAQSEIYNATDNTPVTQLEYYTWCSEFLGQSLPPHGPVNLQRKRGLTNKRVSNAKLHATGWAPIYPSFREGLAAIK